MERKVNLKVLILVVFISNIMIFTLTIYAASNWLFKIDDKPYLTPKDLEDDYNILIDIQSLFQPLLSEKDIKQAKNDNKRKQQYLDTIINEYLILEEAKKYGIYDEKQLNHKAKLAGRLIKRRLIKNLFIKKVIAEQVKTVNENIEKHFYDQLQVNEQTKTWSPQRKKSHARHLAITQEIQKKYILNLETLRSKKKISINSKTNNIDDKEYNKLFE